MNEANTVWDWLASPAGIELTHALVLLLLAITAWISKKAHDRAEDASRAIRQHTREVASLGEAMDRDLGKGV